MTDEDKQIISFGLQKDFWKKVNWVHYTTKYNERLLAFEEDEKEVGEYMQLKRHYHISTDIRKKLGIDEHQTNIGIYIRKLMKQL